MERKIAATASLHSWLDSEVCWICTRQKTKLNSKTGVTISRHWWCWELFAFSYTPTIPLLCWLNFLQSCAGYSELCWLTYVCKILFKQVSVHQVTVANLDTHWIWRLFTKECIALLCCCQGKKTCQEVSILVFFLFRFFDHWLFPRRTCVVNPIDLWKFSLCQQDYPKIIKCE